MYGANDIIAQAIKDLESFMQASRVNAALYSKRLYTKALRCGTVNEKRRVKISIVDKWDESGCKNIRIYLRQPRLASLTEGACYADTLNMIANRNVKTSEASNDRPTRSAVTPNKSYAHAVISRDDNAQKNTSDIPPRT